LWSFGMHVEHLTEGHIVTIEVLSPTGIPRFEGGRLAAPITTLEGRTVAFLSNQKNGTVSLYKGLESALSGAGIAGIYRTTKPVASVAHGDLPGVAASCDVAVVALGD
jgi:hypothetical protein